MPSRLHTTTVTLSFIFVLLLPLCFSHSASFFPVINASSDHHLRAVHFPEKTVTDDHRMVPWKTRRSVSEVAKQNSSLVLAQDRTRRKDPTNGFKYYTGGWNISNRHYFGSVAWTAIPFFFIAAIWFVFFGLCLSCICIWFICCRRKPYGYSRTCYALSLIFLVLFSIAAIVGSCVLYTSQEKFHTSTRSTLEYVVGQADATAKNLTDLSQYLSLAKNIKVGPSTSQFSLPVNVQTKIDRIQVKISSASRVLANQTSNNSEKIQKGLNFVRIALIVVAAVMLLLAAVGFMLSIFGVQCLVYTLVVVGWFLVAGTFILCGVFLLLHNLVSDTCVAMDEWVQHPKAHTSLDDILPCVDSGTASDILSRSKEVTQQLVSVVDLAIVKVSNRNFPPSAGPLYYNQSGPLLPLLCNPYNSDLSDRDCKRGEVDFSNATEVWRNYECEVVTSIQNNEICASTGRLTPTYYNQLSNAENVSYGVYHYTPFLIDLVDCSFVRSTFADITEKHCPGLRKNTEWTYIGLVMVSASVMLSLILWVIYARERRHRVYTKRKDEQEKELKQREGSAWPEVRT